MVLWLVRMYNSCSLQRMDRLRLPCLAWSYHAIQVSLCPLMPTRCQVLLLLDPLSVPECVLPLLLCPTRGPLWTSASSERCTSGAVRQPAPATASCHYLLRSLSHESHYIIADRPHPHSCVFLASALPVCAMYLPLLAPGDGPNTGVTCAKRDHLRCVSHNSAVSHLHQYLEQCCTTLVRSHQVSHKSCSSVHDRPLCFRPSVDCALACSLPDLCPSLCLLPPDLPLLTWLALFMPSAPSRDLAAALPSKLSPSLAFVSHLEPSGSGRPAKRFHALRPYSEVLERGQITVFHDNVRPDAQLADLLWRHILLASLLNSEPVRGPPAPCHGLANPLMRSMREPSAPSRDLAAALPSGLSPSLAFVRHLEPSAPRHSG